MDRFFNEIKILDWDVDINLFDKHLKYWATLKVSRMAQNVFINPIQDGWGKGGGQKSPPTILSPVTSRILSKTFFQWFC